MDGTPNTPGLEVRTALLIMFAALIGGCIARSVVGDENKKLEYKKYADVVSSAKETGKVAFVLISAEWCPPCKKLKRDLDELYAAGQLKKLEFANLDYDKHRTTAKQLMGGVTSIPQLLAVRWSLEDGWTIKRRVGVTSKDETLDWIRKVIKCNENLF